MIWYITLSIIITVILVGLAWKFGAIASHPWLTAIFCLLAMVSVFNGHGRWHQHFMPLYYQHQYQPELDKANNAKTKLSKQITKFNHNDNGHFFFFAHRSKSNLADAQYNAINELSHLRKHQPPKLASNYHGDIITRHQDIQSIIKQLKRHRIYFRTMAEDHVIKQELRH